MSERPTPKPFRQGDACPLCGHASGCSRTNDGLHFCLRTSDNVPGWRWLSRNKPQAQWHLYRREDDGTSPLPVIVRPSLPRAAEERSPYLDMEGEAKKYRTALTPRRANLLADSLGLPVTALDLLEGIGWSNGKCCYTLPERDGRGSIIGLSLRWLDGRKRVMRGGRRGLFLPTNWQALPGPVRIPEGASDVLALAFIGIPCVGRPSAMAGAELLADLLRNVDRPIVVLGENDAKGDGRWPGREGAIWMAERLRELLPGREVSWRLPPPEHKDARAWVLARRAASA
jgi:hypothetical protein